MATSENGKSYVNEMLNMYEDESMCESGVSEVTEFFDGLNVLVTGGSGFLGKLLVEKILR